jgi:hypothetical protein
LTFEAKVSNKPFEMVDPAEYPILFTLDLWVSEFRTFFHKLPFHPTNCNTFAPSFKAAEIFLVQWIT